MEPVVLKTTELKPEVAALDVYPRLFSGILLHIDMEVARVP